MSEVAWTRAARALFKADFQGLANRLSMAPGSLAVGALLPFSVAMVLLFPFAVLVNSAWDDARPLIVAYAMPFAILWAFGPPRSTPQTAPTRSPDGENETTCPSLTPRTRP